MMGVVVRQVRLMREAGYVLGNLDATIILQRPKLSPHKENIRLNLCRILEAHPSTINLKVSMPHCHNLSVEQCGFLSLRDVKDVLLRVQGPNRVTPSDHLRIVRRPRHMKRWTAWARTAALDAMLL
jgi:YgbB family